MDHANGTVRQYHPTNADHINNMDGTQAAYIFTFPGAGFFQDFEAVDWSGASHAFNAVYEVGRAYHLTAALTSSSNQPLTNGASLQMSLYYRDAASNIVNIAATNIVFNDQVFTNLSYFIDFKLDLPAVNATNAWAGKHIGVQFISTTFDPNLVTGVWDVDNVRLTSTIPVPNGSFETPPTTDVDVRIDSWQDQPQSPFFDPAQFGGLPWTTLMGRFANTSPTNSDHLDNMDGTQAAYIFTFPGAGFFQDYDSVDWSNTVPPHTFNVPLQPGRAYTLITAFTSSSNQPLTNGASLEMALYYRDAQSNMVVLAGTNIVFNDQVFTNLNHFIDFQTMIPEIKASDPWAGKPLGITFISTTYDPNLVTGVWDLDNVRLTETAATLLKNTSATNGQISFTLQSEPGLAFEILGATNVAAPTWTRLAAVTNVSGNYTFTDSTTNQQRFYKAHQLP